MPLAWIDHDDFLLHDTGTAHPERPERIRAIRGAFRDSEVEKRVTRIVPSPADPVELHATHDPGYVERVRGYCQEAPRLADDPDTLVSRESYRVALLAAGGVLHAADEIAQGRLQRVFSTHRPPGHHAERDHAMGFCLFNHVALAADRWTRRHGMERVAIVDFDVHHGNGTQHILEERADVLFISIHQDPATLYPGTGYAHETGRGAGEGFTLNLPMPPGSGDEDYRRAFEETLLPRLDSYRPQALLVSAGFDAMALDPLAQVELTDHAYDWMTRRIVEVSNRYCDGRILSVLEGGYHLESLGRGAVAHARAMMD